MAGSEVKWVTLGDVIEQTCEQNSALRFGLEDVRGMTLTKEVIPTKANLSGNDLSKFQIVHPNEFIFNPRTHGKRIGLGYNNTEKPFLISWNNVSFKVKEDVIPEYLYMYLCRLEWDREACYRSWGSSTEVFSWDALCSMKFPLPSIEKQREIVAEWKGLREMKEQNEQIAQPLMELCFSLVEDCKKYPKVKLGDFIQKCEEKNKGSIWDERYLQGVDNSHNFIDTRANVQGVNLSQYKIVRRDDFAYNPARLDIGSWARYKGDLCIVSSLYTIFKIRQSKKNILIEDYLEALFSRSEFNRYISYSNWGSAREYFWYDDMCNVQIPLPPIEIQQAISQLLCCAQEAKKIAEEADKLSNEICPALIQHVIHC